MNQNYNLWLSCIDGIGIEKASLLLKYFKTAEEIYKAKPVQLKSIKLSTNLIDNIIIAKKTPPEYYSEILSKKNINFISLYDNNYPNLLKEIHNPPLGIYILGNLPLIPYIAIVGARLCSEYGILTAIRLSKYFAKKGIGVVSGMAKGIDSYAHKGALEANGVTIAVLGCGVDQCYPKENYNLYNKINKCGAIISEYFPGTLPKPHYFPLRNRIISGISLGTVIVEADINSGSLITADWALEQGKDVFSVPGNINSRYSQGTNNLIKQGAMLITHPDDVLSALNLDEDQYNILENSTATANNHFKDNSETIFLAPDEKLVYYCMSFEPVTVDEIAIKLNIDISQIYFNLTMLELKGVIERLPGGRYILRNKF